jgi:hypothetical protein
MADLKKRRTLCVVLTVASGVLLGFVITILAGMYINDRLNGGSLPASLSFLKPVTKALHLAVEEKLPSSVPASTETEPSKIPSRTGTSVSKTVPSETKEPEADLSLGVAGMPPSWLAEPIEYPGFDPIDVDSPFIVPAMKRVEPEYFDDAVMIGNSIIGMQQLSGSIDATYYTKKSLQVVSFYTEEIRLEDGTLGTIPDALETRTFGKVYLMLGLNEMSWPDFETLMQEFEDVMDTIIRTQPDAIFYVQSILPVEAEYDELDILPNNELARNFNKAMIDLCDKKHVWYLNVAEALYDENGTLPVGMASDGVHPGPEAVRIWDEYLFTHAIPEH